MKKLISNCIYGYQCDKSWDDLKPTEDANIRQCMNCRQDVHYCSSSDILMNAIQSKLCVAVDIVQRKKKVRILGYPLAANIPNFLRADK